MLNREEIHFLGKVAQKALICSGERVLILRAVGDVAVWELPGGRLNAADKDPKAGLVREVKEELGVLVRVGDIVYIEQFVSVRTSEPHLALVYLATLSDESVRFTLASDEVAEVTWVGKGEWQNYAYYPEYQRALAAYFSR